ncbi:HNH endonuclease signature motif containing protein [Aeromonas caviae]|uniref:HNH endonuclease n=1 Tax=Aeromonas caviae TaxID=648 RepID=UPI0015DCF8F6|nr:HNH endonuclease signature motif containing protein [Aeromonas caviae]BBR11077.1 5-methylcytosine-specific restriction enzyme A [Aeromonas caviae]
MPKVFSYNGQFLDATYNVDTVDGVFGLILESWGPKDRNPEYADAVCFIIQRLKEVKVPYVKIYVISRNLSKTLPNIEARAIKLYGDIDTKINVMNPSANEIRLAIGREVGELKEPQNINSKGGNRFKRILIHSPIMTDEYWHTLASTMDKLDIFEPTADHKKLNLLVDSLLKQKIEEPTGSIQPKQSNITTSVYLRDPFVKAWVLSNAVGKCEACQLPAPFHRADGTPYLEVHHLIPLSEGGSDTISNALAVCPNCHRKLHFSLDKESLKLEIESKIPRLIRA